MLSKHSTTELYPKLSSSSSFFYLKIYILKYFIYTYNTNSLGKFKLKK